MQRPPEEVLRIFKDFGLQTAPPQIALFPAHLGMYGQSDYNIADFLTCLRFEAENILRDGDSLIRKQDIPFNNRQHMALFGTVFCLNRLVDGREIPAETLKYFRKSLGALEKIASYYALKSKVSLEEANHTFEQIIQRALWERQKIALGMEGVHEVYEIDAPQIARGIHLPDGSIDFAWAASNREWIEERREMFRDFFKWPPGFYGDSPEMDRLKNNLRALYGDAGRNGEVLKGIRYVTRFLGEVFATLGWHKYDPRPRAPVVEFSGPAIA